MFRFMSNDPDPKGFVVFKCECGAFQAYEHTCFSYATNDIGAETIDGTSITCTECGKSQSGFILPIEEPLDTAIRCPLCKSTNVKHYNSSLEYYAAAKISGIVGLLTNKTYKCKNCGKLFD